MTANHGGMIVGEVLAREGVEHLFTLCGGHISPILVGAKAHGIGIVDMRDEKNAVFAADAAARMTGIPGVAAVTAGPGVTNAMTALKNALLAQTPLVLFGGATATLLKGRGALQDIDQLSIMRPATKWATAVSTVPALGPTVSKAFEIARSGVPGPVFVEVPVDLLYPEATVREWYIKESGVEKATSLGGKALGLYIKGHLYRQFNMPELGLDLPQLELPRFDDVDSRIDKLAAMLRSSEKPALVVGSQTMVNCRDAERIADAVRRLGIPVWLGGTARGLLGRHADIQFRHARGAALKESDLVIVTGFPFDFRMKYGRGFGSRTKVVSINLSSEELRKNRRPELAIQMNAGEALVKLAHRAGSPGDYRMWLAHLREREDARDREIEAQSDAGGELVDPIRFFLRMEEKMDDDAIIVVDGGDFVATAAYILRPRAPLSWLDPGVFGTLGVGGGFAVGAAKSRPGREIWLVYGDGSSAYSLAEIDTCVRHGLAPIAVIGNDASWAQIARDQVDILGDDVGTVLARTSYHVVSEGYGGIGLLLDDPKKIDKTLDEAKRLAKKGRPVVINVHIRKTDFRKGSISI